MGVTERIGKETASSIKSLIDFLSGTIELSVRTKTGLGGERDQYARTVIYHDFVFIYFLLLSQVGGYKRRVGISKGRLSLFFLLSCYLVFAMS